MYESEELIKSIIEELEDVKRRLANLEAEISLRRRKSLERADTVRDLMERK